jgi:hypothetical protein
VKRGSLVLLGCAIALCHMPKNAAAQTFEITPNFGMHMPVGLLMEGTDPADNSLLRRRQLGALTIGARIALRASRVTIESSGTFSPGLVAITDREATRDLGSRVFMGNVKTLFHLAGQSQGGHWSFHAGPGVGVVHRFGEGWNDTAGTTDVALVIAGRGRLARLSSSKAFVFTVEDYVTRAAFRGSIGDAQPRMHHDVVYSFGMAIPVSR